MSADEPSGEPVTSPASESGVGEAAAWRARKQRMEVADGRTMAYVEGGTGPTVVLLHGNPTSSFLWREVVSPIEAAGYRWIAPDLIGMGDSDPLPESGPDRYTFHEHARHLDVFLERVVPDEGAAFVVHDWGSGLGFHWARRHPDRVRGIAYMEAIVMPVDWSDWPETARGIFQAMRSPAGEEIILNKNVFVERILPASVLRSLPDHVMEEYRRPYLESGESRRPTLTWPREIPIEGEPEDVRKAVKAYAEWLSASEVPKLFVNAEPGSILVGRQREFCRSWPNQRELTVAGHHFVQEDSGPEIGQAVADWLGEVGSR